MVVTRYVIQRWNSRTGFFEFLVWNGQPRAFEWRDRTAADIVAEQHQAVVTSFDVDEPVHPEDEPSQDRITARERNR